MNVLFDGWAPVGRVVAVGTLGYGALVLLLRASGKRTLAQMNSFDFVITVAIGASFGRVLTARTVPVLEAVVAFALLISLQFAVTTLQTRSGRFASVVTSQPALVVYRGVLIEEALRRERFTEQEVLGALRKAGYGSLGETHAVVVESDGRLAVVGTDRVGDGTAVPEPSSDDLGDQPG